MTLVEVLLTLTLLVVIGSVVVPVFMGGFSSVRLRRAGDQLIAQWSDARARAIETGEIRQFRYLPDSGTYRVEPWTGVAAESDSGRQAISTRNENDPSSNSPNSTSANSGGANSVENSLGVTTGSLPEQVTFQSGQIAIDDPLDEKRQVDSMQTSGGGISTPILFFPDGTTSPASIVLQNEQKQFVRLTLRALTGVGRATNLLSREELEQAERRR